MTPLHKAAIFSETPAIVTALLAAGIDIEARDEEGRTPLHAAAMLSETPAIVTTLLDAGANPTAKTAAGATAFALIQENEGLKGSDAYLRLNDWYRTERKSNQ